VQQRPTPKDKFARIPEEKHKEKTVWVHATGIREDSSKLLRSDKNLGRSETEFAHSVKDKNKPVDAIEGGRRRSSFPDCKNPLEHGCSPVSEGKAKGGKRGEETPD